MKAGRRKIKGWRVIKGNIRELCPSLPFAKQYAKTIGGHDRIEIVVA